MYLSRRIEELVRTSNDTRHTIGEFVLAERSHLADYTISDIANATFTSKASVSRFAQALGFGGWREFLRDFVEEEAYAQSHQAVVDANYPFSADDADEKAIAAIADLEAEALADTMHALDHGKLKQAVAYLQRADSIWVFGISPHIYVGSLFCRKMLSIGKPAHVAKMGEYGIVSRSLGPHDCAIIVSYGGDNPSIAPMSSVPVLEAHRVPIIAITSEGPNYLRRTVPCTLTLASRENLYSKVATFATEQSLLLIFNLLFALYFKRDYEQNLQHKLDFARAMEGERKSAVPHDEHRSPRIGKQG